jgi:hypothetical protein
MGMPNPGVDSCCMRHDFCYDKNGLNASDNDNKKLSPDKKQKLQACNQALCDCVRGAAVLPKYDPEQGRPVSPANEGDAAYDILSYFESRVSGGCTPR